jgi:hypothetical protein
VQKKIMESDEWKARQNPHPPEAQQQDPKDW